jgi:bla regulator protein blaR1
MIDPGWFVDIALKSIVVAALALLAAHALRRRSAAERSSVLHGGLLALAVLPLLVALAPRWRVELPGVPPQTAAAVAKAPVDAGRPAAAPRHAIEAASAVVPPPRAAVASVRIDPATVWGLLYSVPMLALLFVLGMSLSGLYALRDRSRPLRNASWVEALRTAQRRAGVRGEIALLHSPDARSPLSWGVRRRIIVLDADAIDPAAAQAVLAHELAHLARHDWIKLLLSRCVTAVYWFNPLVWVLARRCHQMREEAADDAVLRGDVAGVDYAALLLRFARHHAPPRALAAHAIFTGRGAMQHLSQRLVRVLDDGERRAPAMRAWSLGCIVATLAIALPLAAFAPAIAPAHAASEPAVAVTTASTAAPAALAATRSVIATPVALAAATEPAASAASADAPLTFTIAPRRSAQPGRMQVTFEEHTSHGRSTNSGGLALASLQGLSESALGSDQAQAVAFRVVRAAGTLQCEGSARRGLATGTCAFLPDAAFAAELERRGVGRISVHDQLQLALQDARLDVLDELARQGYDTPDVKRYVELSIHDVDVAWLRGLQSVGLKLESLQRLVEFRIHDIDAAWVGDLKAAGYDRLSASQLLEFRIHDVTADTIVELAAAGFADLPAKQLVALHIHDVTPAFAREMKALGYADVGAERLVDFRIHDVTPAFVRELGALGYRDLPASRLVEFRIHDVTPAFIREVNALGYDRVDPDELVAMQIHDVTPAYIRAQRTDGRAPSVDELVQRRILGD